MKIKVGDRFVRDTRFGRISYNVIEIKYSWGQYWNLQETIVYEGEGNYAQPRGVTWEKSRQQFEDDIKRFNARKIPREEIGSIQSYVPRHKFI
jgi:hypothetical protein